ncbi:MAG TPA: response regulator [Candidatus Aquilonibacter sp.]|jgi:two-component system copper resistance phosphate regulon response regulator CusR|nr:response regulator [Candidatus Aquilonibacter sp.]
MRILIAEDDAALAGFVRQGLQGEHYTVDVAEDGEQARAMGSETEYDLVILDLNLPRLDGVAVLRHLRLRRPSLPVLVLTLRSRVEDRVQCLDIGADDYLPKPFSFSELSARIRALLRRSHLPSESVLAVEDLKLDRVEHRAERAGRRIDLTSKEFALLEYLMRNSGRQVSRAMIIEHVWNLTYDTTTNVVDVYINYASSQVDQRKVGKLSLAIQIAFQEMGVFPASTTQIPLDVNNPMPFSTVQAIENVERSTELGRVSSQPTDSLAGASEETDMATLKSELEQALRGEIALREVSIRRETEGLVVSLREFGFFDSGSATIKPQALPALDRIASILAIRTCKLRIEGHTDNIPIHTALIHSNWELSTARATELIQILIVRHRFAPERLSAAGYAEYHPVASNLTAQGRAQNRRVDIVILTSQVVRAATSTPSTAVRGPSPQ